MADGTILGDTNTETTGEYDCKSPHDNPLENIQISLGCEHAVVD